MTETGTEPTWDAPLPATEWMLGSSPSMTMVGVFEG